MARPHQGFKTTVIFNPLVFLKKPVFRSRPCRPMPKRPLWPRLERDWCARHWEPPCRCSWAAQAFWLWAGSLSSLNSLNSLNSVHSGSCWPWAHPLTPHCCATHWALGHSAPKTWGQAFPAPGWAPRGQGTLVRRNWAKSQEAARASGVACNGGRPSRVRCRCQCE